MFSILETFLDMYKISSSGFDNGPGRKKWHHVTVSNLRPPGSSTSSNYRLSIRVDGVLHENDKLNNFSPYNPNGIKVWASSNNYWDLNHQSLAEDVADLFEKGSSAPQINEYALKNLRMIGQRQRFTVKIGSKNFVIRVGPSTLAEAQAYCSSQGDYELYKPWHQVIHKIIYNKLSLYGATAFWTQAKYDSGSGAMGWM